MSDTIEFECGDCGFRCGPVGLEGDGLASLAGFLCFIGLQLLHTETCNHRIGGPVKRAWADGEKGPEGVVLP